MTERINRKVFRLSDAISALQRKQGVKSVPGIYGLVDVSEPNRIRYVGSSVCIANRLYGHWHSTTPSGKTTPKREWLRSVRASGGEIAAVVLRVMLVGDRMTVERQAAERDVIEDLWAISQADLNVALTPYEHPNGPAFSHYRNYRIEIAKLKAENEELRRLVDQLRRRQQQDFRAKEYDLF